VTEPPDQKQTSLFPEDDDAYSGLVTGIVELLDAARKSAARSVNSIMTATYWEIGRRIIQIEQSGQAKAEYGAAVVEKLAEDLTTQFGRGFRRTNLFQMRAFYLAYAQALPETTSEETTAIIQTLSGQFPLPWSHYVKLISVKNPQARAFYEAEALKHGWSVRQMARQISTQFYERTLISRNKAAMLESAAEVRPGDAVTPEEEIRDPFVLEFLDLKDEYSESDLEAALIHHIEHFLLELERSRTMP
jgi:predicted nuclease of restriction endonuclease-like (RecB) superfamily